MFCLLAVIIYLCVLVCKKGFLCSSQERISVSVLVCFYFRALPDITSGPEVLPIFKILTVRKPDVFLPGPQIFKTFKNRKKNPQIFLRFFFVYLFGLGTFDTMRIDNLYLVGKMFKYKSGFSPVRQDLSGKFGCLVLSGQETHCPVRLNPTLFQLKNM